MNKSEFRDWIFESYNRIHWFYVYRRFREYVANRTVTDYQYIEKEYAKRYGRSINLIDPHTFCEKLQWLKLFYRNDLMPVCSDKYRIREYVKDKGYEGLCNNLLGVYENANQIDFYKLPSRFVAKANQGSGWNIVCTDKNNLEWQGAKRVMNDWMKMDLSTFGREWNYREIPPRIVIEEFIEYEPLYDYKLMCFNGIPKYVQLNNDYNGVHYVDFYDIEKWEHLPITYHHFKRSDREIDRPETLDKMIGIASVLSEEFPFVRVDFYTFNNTIVLGEMTFFPSSGLWPIIPDKYGYDEKMGELLELPQANFNLELLSELKG